MGGCTRKGGMPVWARGARGEERPVGAGGEALPKLPRAADRRGRRQTQHPQLRRPRRQGEPTWQPAAGGAGHERAEPRDLQPLAHRADLAQAIHPEPTQALRERL